MKNWILLLTLIFSVLITSLFGQVNVISVNQPVGRPAGNGIYYTLPRTVLRVDVELKVKDKLRGPLSDYAEKFLGITDAIKFDDTTYEISNITLTAEAEPDPDEVYYIEMGTRDSRDPRLVSIEINEKGFLLAVNNIDAQNQKVVHGSQTLEIDGAEFSSARNKDFIVSGKVNISIDTVIRRVAVDTIMVEQMSFRTRALDKPGQDMAVEMVDKIEELRAARVKLLTGFQEVAYDPGTMKYMDSQIRALEEEHLDLFRGKVFTHFENHTFYYIPPKKQDKTPVAVFKFSPTAGVGNAKGGSGDNVEIIIESAGTASLLEGFSGSHRTDLPQNGVAYRIPATANAMLKLGKEEIASQRVTINQLGVVRRLPPQKFRVELSPLTGGIKSLVVE